MPFEKFSQEEILDVQEKLGLNIRSGIDYSLAQAIQKSNKHKDLEHGELI